MELVIRKVPRTNHGRQADRQTGRQADRQTREAERHAGMQTGRQANVNRQTGREADRQILTDRQIERHVHEHDPWVHIGTVSCSCDSVIAPCSVGITLMTP